MSVLQIPARCTRTRAQPERSLGSDFETATKSAWWTRKASMNTSTQLDCSSETAPDLCIVRVRQIRRRIGSIGDFAPEGDALRLLLVEDDARIARFVAKGLREQAYAVDVVATGEDALYQTAINSYDLIILDVMIPGKNGFEVCRELRRSGQRVPVLMLTARDSVEDRITGLDHAADDYLTKPFEFRERLARLRARRRRSGELRPP